MKIRSAYEDNSGSPILLPRRFNIASGDATDDIPICDNDDSCAPTPQRMYLRTQLYAAFVLSMGLLADGISLGYGYSVPRISSAIDKMVLVTLSAVIAAVVGSLLGASLITYVGRRYSLLGTGVLSFIGWILYASDPKPLWTVAGLILCRISSGILCAAFPVYIAETAQPEVRGALGVLPIVFRYIGLLLMIFLRVYPDWFVMAYIGVAISILFFLLMFTIPESPRWYIAKGRTHNARQSLQWFRGKNNNIEEELQSLTQFQIEADKTRGNACGQMFYMENTPVVLIALGLMLFSTLSGCGVIVYYAQVIFMNSGGIEDGQIFANIQGITIVLATIIASVLIDRIGRKVLLYISSVCMIVSFVVLSAFLYFGELKVDKVIGWLPQACVILNTLGTSIGYGSISLIILGEILPLKIRGTAASLFVGINSICNHYINNVFSYRSYSSDVYSVPVLFILVHLVEILFVKFCVPETRGKNLEEIETSLTQRVKNINNTNVTNADVTRN